MKFDHKNFFFTILFLMLPVSASGQLIPDNTLGNQRSIVNQTNNLRQEIRGGARRGNALFHSFREFNVGNNQRVFFVNPAGVGNVFTRVTGNNLSRINGTLGVLGKANLFLINPNGIIFGEGAKLDINGSFIGTTAEILTFGDGTKFSAIDPQNVPYGIKINFPLNFGFNENISPSQPSAEIKIIGLGHSFENREIQNIIGRPFDKQNLPEGLNRKQQNFILLGNRINFDGGILQGQSGNIKIVAIDSGSINLDRTFNLNFNSVAEFGEIFLTNKSLIDSNGHSIEIQGEKVEFTENSILLNENNNLSPSGDIVIKARDYLKLVGIENQIQPTGIYSEVIGEGKGAEVIITSPTIFLEKARITSNTFGYGNAGNINISTKNLNLFYNSEIITGTFNLGKGGDINIVSQGNIQLTGNSLFVNRPDIKANFISTRSANFGDVGNLNITGVNLINKDGSSLSSTTLTESLATIIKEQIEADKELTFSAQPGDININLSGKLIIKGNVSQEVFLLVEAGNRVFVENPNISALLTQNSRISNITFTTINTGKTTINAQEIFLQNGGVVANVSLGDGKSDRLSINATSKITMDNSAILSGIQNPQRQLSEVNILPTPQTFTSSGEINLTSSELNVNQGLISAANESFGDGGKITINADRIRIGNSGSITAFSQSSEGGTVKINSRDIQIAGTSSIISSSQGTTTNADAGGITIDSQKLFLNNSTIATEAREGNGGNITLKVQDLRILDGSRISASVGTTDSDGNPTGGGDGGNININASPGTIVLRDSTINADAVFGSGGNIDITTSTLFSNRPIAEVITATSQFGQQGIVNIEITGTLASNLIQARIPEIAIALPKLENNQCLSPQRSGVEKIDLDRYGSPESPAFQAAPYDVYVLEPQYRDPNAPLRSRDIIEPHVIGTRTDGSKFLGTLCFTKNQEE